MMLAWLEHFCTWNMEQDTDRNHSHKYYSFTTLLKLLFARVISNIHLTVRAKRKVDWFNTKVVPTVRINCTGYDKVYVEWYNFFNLRLRHTTCGCLHTAPPLLQNENIQCHAFRSYVVGQLVQRKQAEEDAILTMNNQAS